MRVFYFFTVIFLCHELLGQNFVENLTTASNVRLTVTNVGTFGNAFRGYKDGTGQPSGEFPAGSGTEHLFESGIWIGGIDQSGSIRVSTSAYDAPQGYAPGRGGFEFTNSNGGMEVTSSLTDNPNYSANSISHQDFVSNFSDENLLIPGTAIPISGHINPMGLGIKLSTYNWNYRFSDFFVIANLEIQNTGNQTYDDLHIGLWANTVVRNINSTPAGSGGSNFYSQGGNGYIDSLNMAYCFDATGDVGITDSYIGQKFLGAEDKNGFHHPDLNSSFKDHYNAWIFNNSGQALFFFPTSDQQRYSKLTDGLNQNPCWEDPQSSQCLSGVGMDIQGLLNSSGNRSDLVSVGPFDDFKPDDKINIAFAFILGKKNDDGNPNSTNSSLQKENFISNAEWAQVAYNGEDVNFNGILDEGEDRDGNGEITRFILPSPPNAPRVKVIPGDHQIDLYWSKNSENSIDPITQELDFEGYRIYLSKLGFDVTGAQDLSSDFIRVAEFDIQGNGLFYETGMENIRLSEPVYFPGDSIAYQYHHKIENLPNGWQHAVAITAFDRGNEATKLESLESSFLANDARAFTGTPPSISMKNHPPYVYPNPYYAGASWEGQSNFQEESRKIIFANLPARCEVTITSPAGDVLDQFFHNQDYSGSDIRWFQSFSGEANNNIKFSGGEHSWDLLTNQNQILSRGIYLFSVRNIESGEFYTGQFTVLK